MSNLETVKKIYEAFGTGDIPFILEQLDENIAWESWADNSAQTADVPWLKARNSKEGVLEFFQIVNTLGVKDFQVLSLMEGENKIAAEIVIETEFYRDEEMHLWTFNSEGKLVHFRHYVDTAKHIAAAAEKEKSASS
jgi:ketosteroid isomerase-like protein